MSCSFARFGFPFDEVVPIIVPAPQATAQAGPELGHSDSVRFLAQA